MGLTVTLINETTEQPVAFRAILINFNSSDDALDVTTDERGQFTINEQYNNLEFNLIAKYYEKGESWLDLLSGNAWQDWTSDTLTIPVKFSPSVPPINLGAGITVALKVPNDLRAPYSKKAYDQMWGVNLSKKIINVSLKSRDVWLKISTDKNGMFLVPEQYRNIECIINDVSDSARSNAWVALNKNYIEVELYSINKDMIDKYPRTTKIQMEMIDNIASDEE